MSALPPIATIARTSQNVRVVPIATEVHRSNNIGFRQPNGLAQPGWMKPANGPLLLRHHPHAIPVAARGMVEKMPGALDVGNRQLVFGMVGERLLELRDRVCKLGDAVVPHALVEVV